MEVKIISILPDKSSKGHCAGIRKRLATGFVAIDSEQNGNYDAPVILIGRLARDIKTSGTGLGEHLLLDALFRSYNLSNESIGAMAVVVDPINKRQLSFIKNMDLNNFRLVKGCFSQ